MRILLLIDDNGMLLKFTAASLEISIPHLKVVKAGSVTEAVEGRLPGTPGIAVVHVNSLNGSEADHLSALLGGFPGVKVIVVTEDRDSVLRREILARGAFEVLVRPYEVEHLIEVVRKALARPVEHVGSGEVPRNGRSIPPGRPEESLSSMRHRVRNRLSGIMFGVQAFANELRDSVNDPQAVSRTIDNFTEKLIGEIYETSSLLGSSEAESRGN